MYRPASKTNGRLALSQDRRIMEPDRADMVFLGVTVIAVIAFGVYIMFGPW